MHTKTPQVVVGVVEPRTPRLTARTCLYQTSFLLSATNTQYEEVGWKGKTLCAGFLQSASNTHRNRRSRLGEKSINKNNPKVAVEETGSRKIQVDIKSGECQQQSPDVYIHTCLGQVLHTDYNPLIDIGGDKDRMNKMTRYRGESGGLTGNQSGAIGDKGGSDDKGVIKIEQG